MRSGRISLWIKMLRIFDGDRGPAVSQRYRSSAGSIINTSGFRVFDRHRLCWADYTITMSGSSFRQTQAKSNAISQSNRRLPGLDGLRGLAVIRVLAHHFFDHGPIPLASYHLPGPVVDFWKNATFGADMFFVLSGFLVTW